MEAPVTLEELSRRGMDARMQEVVNLLTEGTVPQSADRKITRDELWAFRFGPPCACGERGMAPDEDADDLCHECRAAEAPASDLSGPAAGEFVDIFHDAEGRN